MSSTCGTIRTTTAWTWKQPLLWLTKTRPASTAGLNRTGSNSWPTSAWPTPACSTVAVSWPNPLLSGGLELDLHLAPDKKDKATLADGRFITQGLALDAGSVLMGPLDLNSAFKASYGHQNNNLRLDSATVAWPGLDAAVSGNVSPKTMKLDLTGVKLDLARLKELFPSLIHPVRQGLIKADLSLSGDPARPRKWKLGGKAELSEAVLELGFLSDTLILGGPFEFKGRKVSFPLLNGKLGATTLAVDGEADLFTDPGRAELDLDLDKFDLAGIAALAKDGRTGRQAESPFPPHWCSRLFWQGRVKVGTLSHLGRSLEKVRIKYHLDQGRLLLAPFKADIKPRGDLALNLTLDLDPIPGPHRIPGPDDRDRRPIGNAHRLSGPGPGPPAQRQPEFGGGFWGQGAGPAQRPLQPDRPAHGRDHRRRFSRQPGVQVPEQVSGSGFPGRVPVQQLAGRPRAYQRSVPYPGHDSER